MLCTLHGALTTNSAPGAQTLDNLQCYEFILRRRLESTCAHFIGDAPPCTMQITMIFARAVCTVRHSLLIESVLC